MSRIIYDGCLVATVADYSVNYSDHCCPVIGEMFEDSLRAVWKTCGKQRKNLFSSFSEFFARACVYERRKELV